MKKTTLITVSACLILSLSGKPDAKKPRLEEVSSVNGRTTQYTSPPSTVTSSFPPGLHRVSSLLDLRKKLGRKLDTILPDKGLLRSALEGDTTLMMRIRSASPDASEAELDGLIDHAHEHPYQVGVENYRGDSPLSLAEERNLYDLVEYLKSK